MRNKPGRPKVRTLTPTPPLRIPVGTPLAKIEEMALRQALQAAGQNKSFAAELLGVCPLTIANRLRNLDQN